jgi:hypothetical protein
MFNKKMRARLPDEGTHQVIMFPAVIQKVSMPNSSILKLE